MNKFLHVLNGSILNGCTFKVYWAGNDTHLMMFCLEYLVIGNSENGMPFYKQYVILFVER